MRTRTSSTLLPQNTALSLIGDEVSHCYDILKSLCCPDRTRTGNSVEDGQHGCKCASLLCKTFGALQTLSIPSHSWNGIFHTLHGYQLLPQLSLLSYRACQRT